MIVIVTGGRTYAGTGLVEALDALEREEPGFYLLVGDADGADRVAREWSINRHPRRCLVFEAHWAAYGKKAGPERNARMVRTVRLNRAWQALDGPVLCLAAPGGRGTADCVRRCREAGFEVREVTS